MNTALLVLGGCLMLPALGVRTIFLAPTRLGWLNYLPNVFSEFFVKRLLWPRGLAEWGLYLIALPVLWLATGRSLVPALAFAILLSWDLVLRALERKMLCVGNTTTDALGPHGADREPPELPAYPTPSVHPDLIINLQGPFVSRRPGYSLGTLVEGRVLDLTCIVGNHSRVPVQAPWHVTITCTGAANASPEFPSVLEPLPAGRVTKLAFHVSGAGPGCGRIVISVHWGDRRCDLVIDVDQVVPASESQFNSASITRYPGASRAAFAWRGDMDLYDTATLQSIEGLQVALGLGARYHIAQTMYLSTRLSLDQEEAKKYQEHFGVDRGWREIPRFITWFQENVDLRHACPYPFDSDRPYVIELGNHGHLHYGTDTAAAEGNGWKIRSKINAGTYPWVTENADSFTEQRDNALEAARVMARLFGYRPKSWAMPDRTRDEHTPAAMEAAGCTVLSDSDVRTIDNVLRQPPPHHPPGTRAVELTKRYPGDPQHIYHVAMNVFWMHRAHRLGIPVIFMCHQHMRQFDGHACERLTEYILRYALTRFHGDLHVDTVFGIGDYYARVLSPETGVVSTSVEPSRIEVRNDGDSELSQVPVDVRFSGGGRATYLLDLPPMSVTIIDAKGQTSVSEAKSA